MSLPLALHQAVWYDGVLDKHWPVYVVQVDESDDLAEIAFISNPECRQWTRLSGLTPLTARGARP